MSGDIFEDIFDHGDHYDECQGKQHHWDLLLEVPLAKIMSRWGLTLAAVMIRK